MRNIIRNADVMLTFPCNFLDYGVHTFEGARTLAAHCSSLPGCASFAFTRDRGKLQSELYRTRQQNLARNHGWTYYYNPAAPLPPPSPAPPPSPPSPSPSPPPPSPSPPSPSPSPPPPPPSPSGYEETIEINDSNGGDLQTRVAGWASQIAKGRVVYSHGEWSGSGWADTHKQVVAATPAPTHSSNSSSSGSGSSNPTITVVRSPQSGAEGRAGTGGWLRIYNSVTDLDTPGEYVILESNPATSAGGGDGGGDDSVAATPTLLLLVYATQNR